MLDEFRLVVAALQAAPGHELDPRLDDERFAQALSDGVGQRVVGGAAARELDADRQRRILLDAGRGGPHQDVAADVGRELCQRAGAKALLGGTIAMLGASYVVTLNAQDCVDGRVLAEEQAQAPAKESVLSALGTTASKFREKLGESLASIQRYDAKIEEGTTASLEALKAYSQGLRTRRTTGDSCSAMNTTPNPPSPICSSSL